jgi:hypothetical protein
MKTFFIILKGYISIGAIFAMSFAAHFSLGTKEKWNFQIKNHFWEFLFSRLLFTVIAGILFFILSLLLNRLFRKSVAYKKKYILFEFIAIVIISVLLVLKTVVFQN